MPSKEQTVKKAEWQEPGGLFQGSFNSSLTRKSLWCAARFCSLWLWAGVTSKLGERGGMRVRSMWLRNESPKKFFLFFFPLALQGHCYSSSYLKCSGTFLPWCLFFYFFTFECWKLTHATVWKLLFLQKSFKQVDCILQNAGRHPLCCAQKKAQMPL